MKNRSATQFYECPECGNEFDIKFDFTPPDAGNVCGPPESCWPPEDAEFDLIDPTHCPQCNAPVNEEKAKEKAVETYMNRDDYRED